MRKIKTIKSALISVFHKDGLEPLVKELYKNNVTISQYYNITILHVGSKETLTACDDHADGDGVGYPVLSLPRLRSLPTYQP